MDKQPIITKEKATSLLVVTGVILGAIYSPVLLGAVVGAATTINGLYSNKIIK